MDNFKLPASPAKIEGEGIDVHGNIPIIASTGFTKIEVASLMIAQGFLSAASDGGWTESNLAFQSVSFAKAVLEECNK